ncbi:MAG: alkaline phosphatase family protein [Rhodocyclaceae bacterium]|nr:alkaline phosphatase family protein [Rhodocyclaceae bacterium]MCA3076787.1 alkaline phosphatase family protein [Rhodocyclaceae bacterium]MCA3089961.1 alkaline phosphatase family protein [Rhodocyclaceae bacterium]MCA3093609.1 alkaline phosphatase family protein [Rhodocyclaceae bacterium]MCA3101127.1 alkaline phosphatase family protein [Rhodocyclaceae bacterium]
MRRVILVVCDGLGRDWLGKGHTPFIDGCLRMGLRPADHRAVFPSVTRVSAASIATGCFPGSHGLYGNQVALMEHGRLVVSDVGLPGFVAHLRAVTGHALRRRTMADRLAAAGLRQVAYSNVSAGAAYFLDPEHSGWVLHRSGSYGPGGVALQGADHLAISHDLDGDRVMTERFCTQVVPDNDIAVGILWLANPDLTLHHQAVGGPEHLEALRVVDSLVEKTLGAVERARERADILVGLCSDHGHEAIGDSIHVGRWLASKGLANELEQGRIAVASQGTAGLIYSTPDARAILLERIEEMAHEPWAGRILDVDDLRALGLGGDDALAAAVDTAPNARGIPGNRWLVADGEKAPEIGCGHHGGIGPDETRPFLALMHPQVAPAVIEHSTSLPDIAPTLLRFLGQPCDGMEGRSLFG